jgi:hypothetical protein
VCSALATAIFASVILIADADARGRKGSFRVGGYNSHGTAARHDSIVRGVQWSAAALPSTCAVAALLKLYRIGDRRIKLQRGRNAIPAS